MSRTAEYQVILQTLHDWDSYLLSESRLPGPRANLELAQAVAEEGDLELFLRYIRYTSEEAPVNSPREFLVFCGVLGLGRFLVTDSELIQILRRFACDSRWRIREAVVMALQRFGDVDMTGLLAEMKCWSLGTPLEQRAAAAAICEPRLLGETKHACEALQILDTIVTEYKQATNRKDAGLQILRQGLGYCWSVAVVALPMEGKALMEKWLSCMDKDVLWIMKENLRKNRLAKLDDDWVTVWLGKLAEKAN
jgi:hypothetical protein